MLLLVATAVSADVTTAATAVMRYIMEYHLFILNRYFQSSLCNFGSCLIYFGIEYN